MSIRTHDIPDADETRAVRDAATLPTKRPRPGGLRRVVRWSVRLAVAGVLLLLLVVALLPTLVSTEFGRSRIVAAINPRIPGHVEIDGLNIAWLNGQSLQGFRLFDPQGDVVASLGEVRLEDVGLIGLLRGTRDLGIVAVEHGVLRIVEDEDGRTNLDRALGAAILTDDEPASPDEPSQRPPSRDPAKTKTQSGIPADLRLAFALRDVKVSMVGPSLPDVRVEVPEATLTADGPAKLGFTFDATVVQGEDRGVTKLVGTAKNLFDADGRWTFSAAEFDVEGVVESVPLAALDRLIGRGPRLQTILGPTLDAEISFQGPTTALDALITATSENLNVRQGLVANAQRLAAASESRSTLVVTPAAWAELMGHRDNPGGVLVEPFTLTFGLSALNAPRDGQTLDLTATKFLASIKLDAGQTVRLDVPERGRMIVEMFSAVVESESAEAGASFTLEADLDAYGKRGTLAGVVELRRGEAGWKALEIESVLRSLPMPVVDALTGQGERLTATFGETIGLAVLARADGEGGYALTADFDPGAGSPGGSRLSGTMAGSYAADGAVTLKTDKPLRLMLTPEAFLQWQRPVAAAADMGESVGLSLPEPAQIAADLDVKFALAGGPGLRFDPTRTSAVAVIELPDTQLRDEWYHRGFPLRNGTVRIEAPDLRKPITANLEFETESADGEPGRLTADLTMTGVMLDDGYIQLERGQLAAEVELDRVPTVVFDALSRQRGYAVAAFGETVSADMSLEAWSYGGGGRVEFELSSANHSLASFSGEDRGGYFVPDAPITLFLNQTPELSNKILRFLNPILLPAVVSATVPMAVTIDDDTFRMPTRNFDLSQIDADVRVQMGTITIVPNVSPVDKMLPQLQTLGLLERASLYEARVSPITLAIRDGVFGYEDLSFKIDDVTLSFGGTISLVDQSIDMGMTLGGREIERDPLLQRLVGQGIKIGGTVQAPEVNLGSVLNAFSKEQLPQTLGGLLEGVLKKELGKEKPTAEPTPANKPEKQGETTPTEPPAEPAKQVSPEEALGDLLGDFLNRELKRAQEKNEAKRTE